MLLCCLLAVLLPGCSTANSQYAIAGESRELLIIMYHSVLKDESRSNKYTITPDTLESDILLLQQEGYECVSLRELVDFVDGIGDLPEKPVILSFDDGYYNNMTYVLPLLIEYDCRAVISIVGEYTETYTKAPDPNPNYAYLSRDELYALVLSGRVELANHSYAMHCEKGRRGSGQKIGESDADYARAFTSDVQKCQDLISESAYATPLAYAYPFGIISDNSRGLLATLGIRISFSSYEATSTVTRGNPLCLYSLGRFNRGSGESSEAFFAGILGA